MSAGNLAMMLRLVREHKGLTQVQLAERAGVPQTHISQFERRSFLNERSVERLAAAMGLAPIEFYKLGIQLLEKSS